MSPQRPESHVAPPARRAPGGRQDLDPAEGAEAAVDRDHDAVDETGTGTAEPNPRADQVLRLAEPARGGVLDDGAPPPGEGAVIAHEQRPVLLPKEEPG